MTNLYDNPLRGCNPQAARIDQGVDYCLAPGTRILKADLTWEAVEKLEPGDEIVGFDEDLGRKPGEVYRGLSHALMGPSTVLRTSRTILPSYRITTDHGGIIASDEHKWVARTPYHKPYGRPAGLRGTPGSRPSDIPAGKTRHSYGWKRSDELAPGDEIAFSVDPWEKNESREGGYMAGLLDGEGWCDPRRKAGLRKNGAGTYGTRTGGTGIAQNPGEVLDSIFRILSENDVPVSVNWNKPCVQVRPASKWAAMRMLGIFRPLRLMRNSRALWDGANMVSRNSRPATVVKVEYIGEQEVIGTQTTTKTLIADGYFTHNTVNGPAYALGPSVITIATTTSGWPGGGAVVGTLTDGPLKGHSWYVTEGIAPSVSTGDRVTASTKIGDTGSGFTTVPWIETGWATTAQPSDVTLATQRGDADPNIGAGEWSTAEGKDYSDLLAYLGAPAGILTTAPHGTNPWNSVALMKAWKPPPPPLPKEIDVFILKITGSANIYLYDGKTHHITSPANLAAFAKVLPEVTVDKAQFLILSGGVAP